MKEWKLLQATHPMMPLFTPDVSQKTFLTFLIFLTLGTGTKYPRPKSCLLGFRAHPFL